MDQNLKTTLDRADELLAELKAEYERSLTARVVSNRAVQLTHDVCEKLRSVLDRTARRYWELHVSPQLTDEDRNAAAVYFPIASNQAALDSTLGRWRWKAVRAQHQAIYDVLASLQPYTDPKYGWLSALNELAVQGKHIDLIPQRRSEERRITVSTAGGAVSWGSGVTFGSGVSIMGAPIDPRTQRVVPTAGVTEKIETWVAFHIEGFDLNALGFCEEACKATRGIVADLSLEFAL